MSNQTSQKLRRMASPSTTKQGPMKATQSFGLMQGSPTASRSTNGRKISPSSSPTPVWSSTDNHRKNRRSPDLRSSPERCSPSPPCFKGDKSKTGLRTGLSPVSYGIKRTGSLETIANVYLIGEWPKDLQTLGSGISDKSTQTPDEWDDSSDRKRKGSHKRSSSVGNGSDVLNKKEIKASLAKNRKDCSRGFSCVTQRTSPIQGNHYALTTSLPAKQVTTPYQTPPRLNNKMRGSVEGLNQEIEKLILTSPMPRNESDEVLSRSNAPDGHRAPVIELLTPVSCSVDTQTPSGFVEEGKTESPPSNYSSRPQSESPSNSMNTLRIAEREEESEDRDQENKEQTSPELDPKSFSKFVREPPDGCERVINVKMEENDRERGPPLKETPFCPIMKPSGFDIPSQQSAFTQCPLLKPYVNQSNDMAFKTSKSAQDISNGNSVAAT